MTPSMSNQQLALPSPYGYNMGYHVSLRAHGDFDAEGAKEVITGYGCPARVADKAIACLKSSERYDCVMMPYVYWGSHSAIKRRLGQCGVELIELSKPNNAARSLEEQKARERADAERPGSLYKQIRAEQEVQEFRRMFGLFGRA